MSTDKEAFAKHVTEVVGKDNIAPNTTPHVAFNRTYTWKGNEEDAIVGKVLVKTAIFDELMQKSGKNKVFTYPFRSILEGHSVLSLPRDFEIEDAIKFSAQAGGFSAGIVPTKQGFGIRCFVYSGCGSRIPNARTAVVMRFAHPRCSCSCI